MFSFFRKHAASYPVDSRWSVLTGEHDGRPMFVRRNESAKELRGHASYGHRVGVAIPLCDPDPRGLPKPEESALLGEIEDVLADSLEANQDSLQVLAITTGSMREFMFYTRVPDAIEQRVIAIRARFPSHEVQFYVAHDPKWEGFAQFG